MALRERQSVTAAWGAHVAQMLPDGRRLHQQHGPIDLVIEAFGEPDAVAAAYRAAQRRFAGLLAGLAAQLPVLRGTLDDGAAMPAVADVVAMRMLRACWPHRSRRVTPMAAVAGAVADEVLAAMCASAQLVRAYVNNGGDIALHLAPGARFTTGIVSDLTAPVAGGVAQIDASDPVRGIATSGWCGRSLSLGIADSVTVLAGTAAAADVAATLLANAVDVDDSQVRRLPAIEVDENSDLGERLVTVAVGALSNTSVHDALARGVRVARAMRADGLLHSAVLQLAGQARVVMPVSAQDALAINGIDAVRADGARQHALSHA